ncbi:MAG: hypothetical protein D6737_16475 [Chloroflexi bacterium]|nr:MAG: hypothetical protein D6737_16475 [Chloroflexota bacterium]
MLDYAERKRDALPHLADRLKFYHGDALTHTFDERFKLVLLPYNVLPHLGTQDMQIALLERCREWVHDDGLIVIDMPNAGETFATQDSDAVMYERSFIDPESGHYVIQQAVTALDRVQQILEITWLYDEIDGDGIVRRTVSPTRYRLIFQSELRLMFERVGLAFEAVYGDFDRSPFADGCPRMIVLARPV